MKKTIIVAALVVSVAGCGSAEEPVPTVDPAVERVMQRSKELVERWDKQTRDIPPVDLGKIKAAWDARKRAIAVAGEEAFCREFPDDPIC